MACGPPWVTLEASGFTLLTRFKKKSSLDVGAHASKKTVECGKSSRNCCGLSPIHRIPILPSERVAEPLKNVEAISGAGRTLQAIRLGPVGSKQGSARSAAIEKYRLDRGA